MHVHRSALFCSAISLACQLGGGATGTTADTGDATDATTTGGDAQPCGVAANSIDVGGICYCEPGTTWVDPFDPSSFECAPLEPRTSDAGCDPEHGVSIAGGCSCDAFFTWCSYDDVTDTSCCYDPAQDPSGEHGTATATADTTTSSDSDAETGTSTGDASTGTTSNGDSTTLGVTTIDVTTDLGTGSSTGVTTIDVTTDLTL